MRTTSLASSWSSAVRGGTKKRGRASQPWHLGRHRAVDKYRFWPDLTMLYKAACHYVGRDRDG